MKPLPQGSSILVLTGAGISAESGLQTFRDGGGLWENHRLEDVATPEAFDRDPDLVHRFYNERRRQLSAVAPNPAHHALARLEQEWPGPVLIVTQNVDDLHERAGTQALINMHGELTKARCLTCGTVSAWTGALQISDPCPRCRARWCLRPHIVWFGEMPLDLERVYAAVQTCGLFAAIGTSGEVYPAGGLVTFAQKAQHTVELNLQPNAGSGRFKEQRMGRASETVPRWVDALLSQGG